VPKEGEFVLTTDGKFMNVCELWNWKFHDINIYEIEVSNWIPFPDQPKQESNECGYENYR
jgi:hypothetical protein